MIAYRRGGPTTARLVDGGLPGVPGGDYGVLKVEMGVEPLREGDDLK